MVKWMSTGHGHRVGGWMGGWGERKGKIKMGKSGARKDKIKMEKSGVI